MLYVGYLIWAVALQCIITIKNRLDVLQNILIIETWKWITYHMVLSLLFFHAWKVEPSG